MPPRTKELDKYMPEVIGWDRLKPLPEKFTAHPDPVGDINKKRRMIIEPRMEKLISDGRPTFIDLFSGCGGFSLGFIKAGWRCIASVEWEYWSHVTYCFNIPTINQAPLHAYTCDIKNLTGREILMNAGITEVDAVIGSPPCQSFSMAGKRTIGDEKDNLLWEFGRLVKEIQPKTYVMENVPGMRTKKLPDGRKVFDVFQEYLKSKTVSDLQGITTKAVMENLC